MAKSKRKRVPKTVPRLPDLEQSKSAVLNSLTSASSKRSYDHAIREFIDWYCSEPRLAFNRTVVTRYRIALEQHPYAPSTINLRLAAIRRLINQLVTFSMSASIFTHLCGIALLHKYNYIDNDGNRREFYFLRDNGFIRPKGGVGWLEFDKQLDAKNVNEVAEPTPIGLACVRLRKSEIPANMITDLGNLKLNPNML